MKFTTSTVLLAAAIGATARPSAHGHQHAHRSLEARNFVKYEKPAPPPPPPPSTTEKAPAPTTAQPEVKVEVQVQEKPKSSPKPESSKSPSVPSSSGTAKPFCNGVEYTKYYDNNSKRATLANIMYKGNIGAPDNYGCNWMVVDQPDGYDHIMEFYNAAGKEQECVCFNKVGPTNDEINGFFNGKESIKFNIGAGETKYVAADDNTQGGCSCGVGSVPLTSFGEFAATWLEVDFKSEINDDWSGADVSCLVSAKFGLDIPGMKLKCPGETSVIYPGGTGENAYLGGMEDEDGIGCNITPGKVHLEITVGYTGKE